MKFEKQYLAGIAASVAVFGFFGLIMVGGTVAAYAGISMTSPIEALATGPTVLAVADLTTPFGLTPADVGLAPDTTVVLPAFPVTVTVVGITVSMAGLTVAEVFGTGGMLVGFLVGVYFVLDIMWAQRTEA